MNRHLLKCMEENTPKISSKINGIAKETLKRMPYELDATYKSSLRMLSPDIDFVYEGYRQLTPEEEYRSLIQEGSKYIDLATSNLYAVRLRFRYEGQLLEKDMYLPYAEKGNVFRLSNTYYSMSPVLTDRVITPSDNSVFIRLLISKIFLHNISRNIVKNGNKYPLMVIWSQDIIRVNVTKDNIGKPVPPIALLLFGRHSLLGTFSKYMGIEEKDIKITLDPTDYLETHNVYSSTKIRPRSHRDSVYMGHNVHICIDNKHTPDTLMENTIASMMYALDMLPELGEEYVDIYKNRDEDKHFWTLLLGRLVYKDAYSQARISADMKKYMGMLDYYLDSSAQSILRHVGQDLEDFYALLIFMLKDYNGLLMNSKEYNSKLNNKYVNMSYYISYPILYAFNNVILSLNKAKERSLSKLTFKEVNKILSSFSYKKIFDLIKTGGTNLTLCVQDNSLDLMYIKSTSTLED